MSWLFKSKKSKVKKQKMQADAGNKGPPTPISADKQPDLVRSASNPINENCMICFDRTPKGLMCGSSHFVCSVCFDPYVRSLCQDIGKFSDAKFCVSCPVPDCKADPWNSYHVRKTLEGVALEEYIDALVSICQKSVGTGYGRDCGGGNKGNGFNQSAADAQVLLECLNLKCPHCNVVLDHNPDGCAAMRCLGCGKHFCWLCLSVCSSGSSACHSHVRTCKYSPKRGQLFFKSDLLHRTAHKRIQLIALRTELLRIARGGASATTATGGVGGGVVQTKPNAETATSRHTLDEIRSSTRVRTAITSILPILKDVHITDTDVFESNIDDYWNSGKVAGGGGIREGQRAAQQRRPARLPIWKTLFNLVFILGVLYVGYVILSWFITILGFGVTTDTDSTSIQNQIDSAVSLTDEILNFPESSPFISTDGGEKTVLVNTEINTQSSSLLMGIFMFPFTLIRKLVQNIWYFIFKPIWWSGYIIWTVLKGAVNLIWMLCSFLAYVLGNVLEFVRIGLNFIVGCVVIVAVLFTFGKR